MENDLDETSPGLEPVRSEDRRAEELEELRKKQVVKNTRGNDENIGGGGANQPVTLESWFEQQREQSKIIRQNQKAATENLHKYNSAGIQTGGSDVKDELKKKEQEAADMLRNYRGNPQDFFTNQIQRQAKAGITKSEVGLVADIVAPSPGKKYENVPGKIALQTGNDETSDRIRSGSHGTADWSIVSGNDSDSDRGLSSTPVNVDMSALTISNNEADAAAGVTQKNNGDDTPLSSSYVDAFSDMEKDGKKWDVAYVTVSFGLLIHEKDSFKGTYSSHSHNEIVNNMMFKLRLIAEKSLESQDDAMVAKQNEYPLTIMVQKDGMLTKKFINST